MSHVLSDFVSAGATEASTSTSVSVEDEKENECDGQQDRQAQSEGTVLVQNQFVSRTEVRQVSVEAFRRFSSTAMYKFITITEAENQENLSKL